LAAEFERTAEAELFAGTEPAIGVEPAAELAAGAELVAGEERAVRVALDTGRPGPALSGRSAADDVTASVPLVRTRPLIPSRTADEIKTGKTPRFIAVISLNFRFFYS
jgi:hypothetical protein